MLNGNPYCKTPDYLNENEIKEICAFFQGAVYTWCAINKTKKFATRDFIGGINYYWEGSPLYKLYEHYESEGDEDPKIKAGLDAGSLLKKTLSDDKRSFKQSKNDDEQRSYYEWDEQPEINQMIDEETKKKASELVNAIKENFDKLELREISEKYETEIEYGLGQNNENGYYGRFFEVTSELSIWAGYDYATEHLCISFYSERYKEQLISALEDLHLNYSAEYIAFDDEGYWYSIFVDMPYKNNKNREPKNCTNEIDYTSVEQDIENILENFKRKIAMKNKSTKKWPLILTSIISILNILGIAALILCFKIFDKEFNAWSLCILSVSLLIFMLLAIFFYRATVKEQKLQVIENLISRINTIDISCDTTETLKNCSEDSKVLSSENIKSKSSDSKSKILISAIEAIKDL